MLDRKTNKNLPEGQAHLQFTHATLRPKIAKELALPTQGKRNNETLTRAHK